MSRDAANETDGEKSDEEEGSGEPENTDEASCVPVWGRFDESGS
jgi:hypothetical protein